METVLLELILLDSDCDSPITLRTKKQKLVLLLGRLHLLARLLVSPPCFGDWANRLVTISIHVNYMQYVRNFKVSNAAAVFKWNISIRDRFDLCLMIRDYCHDITVINWPVKRQQPAECACGCGSWIKPQGDGLHVMPHRTFWWTHMHTGKIECQEKWCSSWTG